MWWICYIEDKYEAHSTDAGSMNNVTSQATWQIKWLWFVCGFMNGSISHGDKCHKVHNKMQIYRLVFFIFCSYLHPCIQNICCIINFMFSVWFRSAKLDLRLFCYWAVYDVYFEYLRIVHKAITFYEVDGSSPCRTQTWNLPVTVKCQVF